MFNARALALLITVLAVIAIHLPGSSVKIPKGLDWLDFIFEPAGLVVFVYWYVKLPERALGKRTSLLLRVALLFCITSFLQGSLDEFLTHSDAAEGWFESFDLFLVVGLVIASFTLAHWIGNMQRKAKQLDQDVNKYKKLMLVDGLTGLTNRQCFDQTLAADLTEPCSLLMIDVDRFKSINDTYGHPVGDEVIKDLAQVLNAISKGLGKSFRYGGEEFSMLIEGKQLAQIEVLAEAIRIACERVAIVDQHRIDYTVSIGAAMFEASKGAETMMHEADQALYHSKSSGRNMVSIFGQY